MGPVGPRAPLVTKDETGSHMAFRTVQLLIGQILSDENMRDAFLARPRETLTALRDQGLDLTPAEIEALLGTDRRLWRTGAKWLDDRLQRCRLPQTHQSTKGEQQ